MGLFGGGGNKYGIFYTIVRVVLGILIGVILIMVTLSVINHGLGSYSLSGYVWLAISFVSLIIGLLGTWREHFFAVFLLCVGSITLVCLSYYERINMGIWSGNFATGQGMIMAMIALSALYSFMLYNTGHQEMGLPEF
ncbi:uncharacterized protein LOC124493872 [Dermatophagoides farinae]|uniref:Uncharacterized protein n=1 Tax=Dermatophagoides farinae TaxID=6954 RepID=A0A9D4SJR1_DERFA|nr:uncharacterized protein LOC124493872 [Dermatophagoides farinae]KAH7644213.1 hypothetical protein HUG17_6575 [Dermatophagoides farinae]